MIHLRPYPKISFLFMITVIIYDIITIQMFSCFYMTPRQRLKIIQRISEIERGRLEYRKGRLAFRELTEEEKAVISMLQEKLDTELAELQKNIESKFSDGQFELFSVVESCGSKVVMQIPTNRAAIAAERIRAL